MLSKGAPRIRTSPEAMSPNSRKLGIDIPASPVDEEDDETETDTELEFEESDTVEEVDSRAPKRESTIPSPVSPALSPRNDRKRREDGEKAAWYELDIAIGRLKG